MSELEAILLKGDVEEVKSFFAGMPEKQRRGYATEAKDWLRRVNADRFVEISAGTFKTNELMSGVSAAVLCTGSYSELTKTPFWQLPRGNNAFDILSDRRPEWLEQWVQHLLSQERYWFSWRLVRRLFRAGLVQKPSHMNYILGMISGIAARGAGGRSSVRECLAEDPQLLDDEVWRLFEFEGGGENSLANVDRFGQGDWSHSLLAYANEGKLSRERLLACCIEALQRDFNHYRAKWFAGFYDLLEPTAEENRANARAFLGLLGVSAPNIVTWAFKKVQAQVKAKAYSTPELVVGLRPALEARSKGLVKNALKLLLEAASQLPEVRPDVAQGALLALANEDSGVQELALDVLDRCGRVHVGELKNYVEMLAPSLRGRADALIGEPAHDERPAVAPAGDSAAAPAVARVSPELRRSFALDSLLAQPASGVWSLPAAVFDGTELPRLAPRSALTPIADLEELIDVAARVLEDAASADDIERALDGFSRLCAERPVDFERRTAALLKRVKQLLKRGDHVPFVGGGPAADLCGLIHCWVTGEVAAVRFEKADELQRYDRYVVELGDQELVGSADDYRRLLGVLARRVHGIAMRVVAQEARPLLCAPSHTGGLLDPRILAERLNAFQGASPPTIEAVLAMLRLAPEYRGEALQLLQPSKKGEGEWRRAIRYALGAKLDVAKLAKSVALWGAAARSRAPWSADKAVGAAFPKAGPDVGEPAVYSTSFKADSHGNVSVVFPKELKVRGLDDDCVPLVLHTERGERMWDRGSLGSASESGIRWAASLWPTARESFFAAAFTQIAHNIDWWEARWASKALMEPLLDPATPLREMGLLLLVTGLGAKEPGEYGLATDIAMAAIADGRLGSDNLGYALAKLLGSGMIKPARWTKTLGDVARASDAHAAVVKLALEHCLDALAEPPRDLSKLIELLRELCVQLNHGVAGQPRTHLERVKGSNKLAKLAKSILELPLETSEPLRSAWMNLTEMRVSAAIPAA